jgi:hypothetical protein
MLLLYHMVSQGKRLVPFNQFRNAEERFALVERRNADIEVST